MFIGQKKPVIKNGLDVANIKRDELTVDLQFVADQCGIETVITLLKNIPGTNLYIPKIAHLKEFLERYIKENKRKSPKEIAMETNVSESFIKALKCGSKK